MFTILALLEENNSITELEKRNGQISFRLESGRIVNLRYSSEPNVNNGHVIELRCQNVLVYCESYERVLHIINNLDSFMNLVNAGI